METEFVIFPRRDGIPYPQIYSKFKVKSNDNDDGAQEEYYIQDLTENYFDEAVDFIVENHARGAVFHNAANSLANETGIERVRKNYRKAFEEKISLICIRAGTNEVVGLNALHTKSKYDEASAPSDDANFRKVAEATKFIDNGFNVMQHYGVDRYVFAAGLAVDSKYRGRGIATEILKARGPLLKAIGLNVTTSIFSTVGAQKAALAAGYDENYSITYEMFQQALPSLNFSQFYGNSCKVLSLKV